MYKIPFMRPNVVQRDKYMHYFDQIDESKIYSNYGPLNSRFENRVMADFFNNNGDVTTVNNATTGLILAINHMKRRGKYALMPSFTFSATPLAALWAGLTPYFIDIDEKKWCMDEEILKKAIAELGEEVAVVVPYATFGTCLDLTFYDDLHKSGVPVVIDAAASFGAKQGTTFFGTGFSGAIVYSFHATKSFGVGEGGMVYSEDKTLIQELKKAGNFGYYGSRESTLMGLNGKMSEYTAAIALATLDIMGEKLANRLKIYQLYMDYIKHARLQERGWGLQEISGEVPHQFFSILCPEDRERDYFIDLYKSKGIQVNCYFSPPCHLQELFRNCNHTPLENTQKLSKRIICLPAWEGMESNHIKEVVRVIDEAK